MDDSIEDLYKKLTLTYQDEDPILLDVHDRGANEWKIDNCLLVRLLMAKPYNSEAF